MEVLVWSAIEVNKRTLPLDHAAGSLPSEIQLVESGATRDVPSFAYIAGLAEGEREQNRVASLCHSHAFADFFDVAGALMSEYSWTDISISNGASTIVWRMKLTRKQWEQLYIKSVDSLKHKNERVKLTTSRDITN